MTKAIDVFDGWGRDMLRALDLFSCVGCHALGMQRAGIPTVALCESNQWRRSCLAKQFPGVPIHKDARSFEGIKANVVIGGPPCQRTSVASAIHGKRTGESLWPHMLRIGLNVAAEWFVVEQPPGNAAWEAEVGNDLSNSGRHVARIEFGANDIGAPYLRRRVFLVACTSLSRLEIAWRAIPSAIERVKRAAIARGDWDADSVPAFGMDTWRSEEIYERRQRIEALGDSNPPHMAEVIGRAILQAGSEVVI
jgi:site-specific DNA-cytosine methylase